MGRPLTAVYDANVLYPAPLRDLLIRTAQAGLVRAKWTEAIHDEWSVAVGRPSVGAPRRPRSALNSRWTDRPGCGINIPQAGEDPWVSPNSILWDLDDDPNGNVLHCEEHGVTKEEVEEAFENVLDMDVSRTSGLPVIFGETNAGRHLLVVYERVDDDVVYPVTAYEVPRRRRR